MPQSATITTDHSVIQEWVEKRGGKPATVKLANREGKVTILRIHFPGRGNDDELEDISWTDFFDAFDKHNLAFLHQETTADGKDSRFFKFVRRAK
ncbi:hypothetical protein HYS00_01060 [Candidatus Microgenomates bacterium]|nr:hypothetical protein [Candidatus Microgenomates bacterium]